MVMYAGLCSWRSHFRDSWRLNSRSTQDFACRLIHVRGNIMAVIMPGPRELANLPIKFQTLLLPMNCNPIRMLKNAERTLLEGKFKNSFIVQRKMLFPALLPDYTLG